MYWEKSQAQDEILQHIVDGAALKLNSHVTVQKATRAVVKLAHLCGASAGGHF
jgi:hypothetical protein